MTRLRGLRGHRGRTVAVTVALLAAAMLAGCGGDPSAVAWRDLDLRLPDGWVQIQNQDGVLYVGNGEGGGKTGTEQDRMEPLDDPDRLTVGVQFQTVDTPTVQPWRDLVAERDGTVELDGDMTIGGVPASVLQYTLPGTPDVSPPTRERIIIVTARNLEILAQAVPLRGQDDGPEVFMAHLDEVEQLLDSIVFGAPDGG